VSDTFDPRPADDRPLEEVIENQALDVKLRAAVMACLSGGESRRWKVSEFVERFRGLGICATTASVTTALADLELELELAAWAPWRLVERGNEWILAPKSELLSLLTRARKLPVKGPLSEEHKAVLLIVIGHRRNGGVCKTRIGEILKLDPSPFLHDLRSQELIYCDPSRELNFWRATTSALLALGLRSSSEIPALKELEEWFEALDRKSVRQPHLNSYFKRSKQLHSRRLRRELERRQSIEPFPGSESVTPESVPRQEGESDSFRGDRVSEVPRPDPAQEPPEGIMQGHSA
jgi:chromosome segregation and condensation protein ScpB